MEAVELHKLARTIQNRGGTVLDLNTDSASCVFPNNELPFTTKEVDDKVLVDEFYFDDQQEKPKYKLEDKDRLR